MITKTQAPKAGASGNSAMEHSDSYAIPTTSIPALSSTLLTLAGLGVRRLGLFFGVVTDSNFVSNVTYLQDNTTVFISKSGCRYVQVDTDVGANTVAYLKDSGLFSASSSDGATTLNPVGMFSSDSFTSAGVKLAKLEFNAFNPIYTEATAEEEPTGTKSANKPNSKPKAKKEQPAEEEPTIETTANQTPSV